MYKVFGNFMKHRFEILPGGNDESPEVKRERVLKVLRSASLSTFERKEVVRELLEFEIENIRNAELCDQKRRGEESYVSPIDRPFLETAKNSLLSTTSQLLDLRGYTDDARQRARRKLEKVFDQVIADWKIET